jgi:hypothetical protein
MAVINLTTLVLRGVTTVVSGGVAVEMRLGWGYQAQTQAPALFSMRHRSPGLPEPISEPDQRRFDADDQAAANIAVMRAGRSFGCLSAGVLGSRSPAPPAGRDLLSQGRSRVKGGSRLSALWHTGRTLAGAMTSADKLTSWCSPKRTDSTGFWPVAGTLTASTRGKGVFYT